MLQVIWHDKIYSIKEIANIINVKYDTLQKFLLRKDKQKLIKYKNIEFEVKNELNIETILKYYWKAKVKNEKLDPLLYFEQITIAFPENKDYQDFYIFIKNHKLKYKNQFDFYKVCYWWKNQQQLWMADTETTFTTLVPEEKLFYDILKGFGDSAKDTIINLNVEKIREYFNNNPNKKPYMWAFAAINFKTREKVLLNYYDAVNYLNNLNKRTKFYFHNLSYDALHIIAPLIIEHNYQLISEKDINKEEKWQLQKKQITIFAKDYKIFSVKIKNELGKIIIFECTYLKLMVGVKQLGKALNKPKLELNYFLPRTKNHVFTQEETNYIFTDIEIVMDWIITIENAYEQRFNKKFNWKLTLGMTAMDILKNYVGKKLWNELFVYKAKNIPIISSQESQYLRKNFYNGGYTNYNIKYVGKKYKNISSLDLKSCYPDKWKHYRLPFGSPIYNCNCKDDLTNNSKHFKLYEIEILEDLKIEKDKENISPTKIEFFSQELNKTLTNNEYYPFICKGIIYRSQYLLKAFFILFNPKPYQYKIKKIMCFNHNYIEGFKKYVNAWEQEKNQPNLKNINRVYYDFTKLMLNAPTGKFGQKEITDETYYHVDENKIIEKMNNLNVINFNTLSKFSYLPIIIATTDMSRLHLISLIEKVGWNRWHNSDTDSCKFWLPKKLFPKYNPTYINLITGLEETIYNESSKNELGKWELEWTADEFKCCGKKKYIYKINNKIHVVCAGATDEVTSKMNFDNFFVGFDTQYRDKNMKTILNGLPTLLPTTFKIKNVFYSKIFILKGLKHFLHGYYLQHILDLEKKIKKITIPKNSDFDYDISEDTSLKLEKGVFS